MNASPAVLVLGAGFASQDEGQCHPLAEPLGGETVFEQTVRHAVGSGLPVVVVTSPPFVEVAARHVARRDVVVLGTHDGSGPTIYSGDSIAAGVVARPHAAGWLVLPADMPLVRPQTLRRIAQAFREQPVVFAQYRGLRGHPVAFAGELFSELIRLSGEGGARRLLARYPAKGVEVDDPGVLQDMAMGRDASRVRSQWAAL